MINNKKKLIIGIGSALLVLLLAGAGVFAWYMNLTSNLIDPQTLQVTTSQFLEVRQAAAEGEESAEFGNVLELSFDNLVLVDITGDGATLVIGKDFTTNVSFETVSNVTSASGFAGGLVGVETFQQRDFGGQHGGRQHREQGKEFFHGH